MPVSRIVGPSIALAVMACASLRVETPARGALEVELQDAHFDGRYLQGRILVRAVGGPVTLDGRLIAHSTVTVEKVLDCLTNEETHWVTGASFPSPPGEADLITLKEGDSREADVKLLVFAEEVHKKPSPDCILATVGVWPSAAGGQKATPAEVVVRVTTPADAGLLLPTPEPDVPVTPDAGSPDGGTPDLPDAGVEPDAGIVALPSVRAGLDAGTPTFTDSTGKVIPWPTAIQPVAVLDGPAIIAANAALQHVLARFPKEHAQRCAYSAKAMEVTVGQQDGLYFVNINHQIDRCGWAAPGSTFFLDWFEFYAVSPEGRILARYPYSP